MRKITKDAVNAFKNGLEFNRSNTRVSIVKGFIHLFLFDNLIAARGLNSNDVIITNAGYKTNTTKERLNGVLSAYTQNYIYQKRGVWYYNNTPWNGKPILITV
jgi:hypothetical protein